MVKVLAVFGTRPEAIKMAPLVIELKKRTGIECKVAVTAQHREMLDQVLEIFNIKPDYDLNIMKAGQTLFDITADVLMGFKNILSEFKVDMMLVHGDTSTTFAASLAAYYQKIPIGHVEAGLRTGDKYAPFPEEMNRKLTGALVDLHFAPTKRSKQNLLNEGVNPASVYITGNTVIDALKMMVCEKYKFNVCKLDKIDYNNKRVLLVTAHRRENYGEALQNICHALKDIKLEFENVEIVFPVHKNPAVRNVVYEVLDNINGIHIIEPLDYKQFVNLIKQSYIILTDSGGLQEEAPALGKPVLVMRDVTERPEAVEAGTVRVVGTKKDDIKRHVRELLNNSEVYNRMAKAVNPYGDGYAAKRIADAICYWFGLSKVRPGEFVCHL